MSTRVMGCTGLYWPVVDSSGPNWAPGDPGGPGGPVGRGGQDYQPS